MPKTDDKITIANFASPGHTYRVDRQKYEAMRAALLKVLPAQEPGMTPGEAGKAVLPHLPDDLFPGGAKAGWWLKAAQLDMEVTGVIKRGPKPPVRLWRV